MASDEEIRDAIAGLAPKGMRGPHSQFVKDYNRALRDVFGALDQLRSTPATTTPQGGENDVQEVKEEEGILGHS